MKRISKKEVYLTLLEQGDEIGIKEFIRIVCDVFDVDSCFELCEHIDYECYEIESEQGDDE